MQGFTSCVACGVVETPGFEPGSWHIPRVVFMPVDPISSPWFSCPRTRRTHSTSAAESQVSIPDAGRSTLRASFTSSRVGGKGFEPLTSTVSR